MRCRLSNLAHTARPAGQTYAKITLMWIPRFAFWGLFRVGFGLLVRSSDLGLDAHCFFLRRLRRSFSAVPTQWGIQNARAARRKLVCMLGQKEHAMLRRRPCGWDTAGSLRDVPRLRCNVARGVPQVHSVFGARGSGSWPRRPLKKRQTRTPPTKNKTHPNPRPSAQCRKKLTQSSRERKLTPNAHETQKVNTSGGPSTTQSALHQKLDTFRGRPFCGRACLTRWQGRVQLAMAIAYYRAPRVMGGELRVVEVDETCIDKKKRNPLARPPTARLMGGLNAGGGRQ